MTRLVVLLLAAAVVGCGGSGDESLARGLQELVATELKGSEPGAKAVDSGGGTGRGRTHSFTEYSCNVAGQTAEPPHRVLGPVRDAARAWLTERGSEVSDLGWALWNDQLRHFGLEYRFPNGAGWLHIHGLFENDGRIRRVFVVISEHHD